MRFHGSHTRTFDCVFQFALENLSGSVTVMPAMPQFPIVDVVGVGLNATDTIIRLPCYPASDTKLELIGSNVLPGGQIASAMVACQSWGLRTRYVGKVGNDPAAKLQLEELARAGIESHVLEVLDSSSQIAYILIDERNGERTVLWKRDPRLEFHPEELHQAWVTQSKVLLVDGHDTASAAQAARWAKQAQIPVVADIDNLYSGVEDLLEQVDYLIASRDFPKRLLQVEDPLESLPEVARKFGCRLAGVTLGTGGVLCWNGARFEYSPAFKVRAVDTTGAGDIFHAGFVYGLSKGLELNQILKFSCAAAALACTAPGARGGIRPVAEIRDLMERGASYPALYSISGL